MYYYLLPQKSVKSSRCSDTIQTICKQNVWQDTTDIITYISTFLSGSNSVQVCIYSVFIYAVGGPAEKRWEGWWGVGWRVGIPVTGLTLSHSCICLKLKSGFPTSWSSLCSVSFNERRLLILLILGELMTILSWQLFFFFIIKQLLLTSIVY